ncbi:addiction module toxin, HicA family [Candidatus Parcubacteria bacterium]|nr:addiction module toxin, HicA family [Candidatus Parcubacteria bacterium]
MSKIDKLIHKFKTNPETLKYRNIKNVLIHLEFDLIKAKGSHVKYKHSKLNTDVIVPIHNGECKNFYKKEILKILIINKIIK